MYTYIIVSKLNLAKKFSEKYLRNCYKLYHTTVNHCSCAEVSDKPESVAVGGHNKHKYCVIDENNYLMF